MKTKHLLLILFIPLFAAQCKKEEKPDLPSCDYIFECKVNGQTWKPKGSWNSPDISIYYTPDTVGNWIGGRMVISAQHRVQSMYGNSHILFYLDSLYSASSHLLSYMSFHIKDEKVVSLPREEARRLYYYDSIVSSNIVIHEFVPDNYSEDWQRGYINMNFSATLMNGIGDSVNITNGKICMRFQ
jgi:hypothetical protein